MSMDAGHPGRAVVVGVDGSCSALRAVRWAAARAVIHNAPLRIVMAFRPARDLDPSGVLVEAARIASQQHPGLPVQRQMVAGSPIPVLDAESRAALLVVVGDRGTGGRAGLSLGSVAAALGTHARCPVVVVRGENGTENSAENGAETGRPVVVGVDTGSSTCDAALAFAFEEAAARGVALVAVHTWWELLPSSPIAAAEPDAIETAERECLDQRLAGWRAAYPAVPVLPVVQRDLPAHALTERSRDAQLVVVGARGRGWPAGQVLGSVSHTLMHRAHCSVAVVHPTGGAAERHDQEDAPSPAAI
jgi:nucleotide-binding universal stress UspA family protein